MLNAPLSHGYPLQGLVVPDTLLHLFDKPFPWSPGRLGRALAAGVVEGDALRGVLPLARPLPLGVPSPRPPSVSRQPPKPAAIQTRSADPTELARHRTPREYLSRRRVVDPWQPKHPNCCCGTMGYTLITLSRRGRT